MSKITTNSDLKNTRIALGDLTAAYSGNQTNPLRIENCTNINLPIHYLAGIANQYMEVLIETSAIDTLPTLDTDWEPYTTVLAAATETELFDNPFIVPGDKQSAIDVEEKRTIPINVNAKWLRVSVRERIDADTPASSFGTFYLGLCKFQEN